MAIAVCLRFDEQTTAMIEQLWRALDSDMLQLGYPPHLTLIVASEDVDASILARALPEISTHIPRTIELGEPRAFPETEVVYFACRTDLRLLHRLVADLVPHQVLDEHYRVGGWTPHVTLQTKGDAARALSVDAVWRARDAAPAALEVVRFPPVAVQASVILARR